MSIIAWIILGLLSGFIASKMVNHNGQGVLLDILLGIVGACVGGWIFTMIGSTGVTGFNLWSLFVAVIGAALTLVPVTSSGNASSSGGVTSNTSTAASSGAVTSAGGVTSVGAATSGSSSGFGGA